MEAALIVRYVYSFVCSVSDYVGFIKKIMKLMQHNYQTISKLEVELRQVQEAVVPTRPRT